MKPIHLIGYQKKKKIGIAHPVLIGLSAVYIKLKSC